MKTAITTTISAQSFACFSFLTQRVLETCRKVIPVVMKI